MRRKPSLQSGLDAQRPLAGGDPIRRGYKARTPRASLGLCRCFLLLDILANDFQRCAAAGSGKVTATPKHILPVPFLKLGELLAEQAAGNTFEAVDQLREFDARREVDQHDRDENAAENIRQQGILKLKAEGLSVSAHGGGVSRVHSAPATAGEVGSLRLQA